MPTPGYVFKDGQPIPDDELAAQKADQGSVDTRDHAEQPPPLPIQQQSTPASSPSRKSASSSSVKAPNGIRQPSLSSGTAPLQDKSPSSLTHPESGSHPSKSFPTRHDATDSHALAAADHEVKGAAQQEHFAAEVRDMGWQEHPEDVPKPLIGGLPNDELWLLVRRFNKQMYHVKSTNTTPLGGLDLYTAEKDEFSPDKLRANLERLYMTVIVGFVAFGKHIARLRSWREPRRTGAFLAAYFVAWIFDLVTPLIFGTMLTLIVYPPSRPYLFPPAPIALVSSKTGGVQTPKAGVLGSHDSVPGAPEKYRGEAVEQEAGNFVAGFATIAMSSATGKHEAADPESDPVNSSVPDPTNIANVGSDAKAAAEGGIPNAQHDKTIEPMEEAMWSKMRPIMHGIGDLCDTWERFANALSPTRPFPQQTPRLKLGALVAPVLAVSLVTTSYMVVKGTTFVFGAAFFSDPLIWRGLDWLNRTIPDWPKYLQVQNTFLRGVPSNAQLTITLLRIGEANKAPLPPPPRSDEPPPDEPADLDHEELTLDASHDEIQDAIHRTDTTSSEEPGSPGADDKPKKKHGSRILGVLKGTTKAGVESKLATDKVRATIGSTHAKNHLGILPNPKDQTISGPVDFKARYKGHKGWVYINTSATVPCVSFTTHATRKGGGDDNLQSDEQLKPQWSIPINEIRELKKVGGLGWKAKLVVGWATDKTVADGLEITDVLGSTRRVTAVVLREELFNRLATMGPQKWESW